MLNVQILIMNTIHFFNHILLSLCSINFIKFGVLIQSTVRRHGCVQIGRRSFYHRYHHHLSSSLLNCKLHISSLQSCIYRLKYFRLIFFDERKTLFDVQELYFVFIHKAIIRVIFTCKLLVFFQSIKYPFKILISFFVELNSTIFGILE